MLVNIFLQRIDLTIAIVCMVNHTAVDIEYKAMETVWNPRGDDETITPYSNLSSVLPGDNRTNTSGMSRHSCSYAVGDEVDREDGEFVWSKETQGLLLGGVFWGYTGIQIPSIFAIRRFGPTRVVGVSMLLMSLMTVLTPVTARWSPWALLVLRALVGVFTGLLIPGLFAVWTKWAPPAERSRLVGTSFSGNLVGTALAFPVSALLCKTGQGWPSMFYTYGALGILIGVVWSLYVRDDPVDHPRIHPAELQYLQNSIGIRQSAREVKTPWVQMFTSLPLWSILCGHATYNWGLYLFMSTLPIYMREVMRFDIKTNGILSFVPYILMFFACLVASHLSDALISRRLLSVGRTRKLMTLIGHFFPGVLLIVLSYLDCTHRVAAIVLLTLAVGCGGFFFSGVLVNFYDIAPLFAGIMMPIGNAMAGVCGIIAPYAVAEITKDKTREQWQTVFFLTASILGFGTLVHLIFGSGDVQHWADIKDHSDEEQDSLRTTQ